MFKVQVRVFGTYSSRGIDIFLYISPYSAFGLFVGLWRRCTAEMMDEVRFTRAGHSRTSPVVLLVASL